MIIIKNRNGHEKNKSRGLRVSSLSWALKLVVKEREEVKKGRGEDKPRGGGTYREEQRSRLRQRYPSWNAYSRPGNVPGSLPIWKPHNNQWEILVVTIQLTISEHLLWAILHALTDSIFTVGCGEMPPVLHRWEKWDGQTSDEEVKLK